MNNLKKLLIAMSLASASTVTFATDLYISAPSNLATTGGIFGDADSNTSIFDTIVLAPLSPTSNYIDANGNGYVDTGEFVFDQGSTSVLGFNYQGGAIADSEFIGAPGGVSAAWSLDVSWDIFGVAGVTGDGTFDHSDASEVLGAQFFGGTLSFDLIDIIGAGAGNVLDAITIDVTGSDAFFGSAIGFSIFGDIVGSAPGVLFDSLDVDLSSVLNTSGAPGTFISVEATTDLDGLEIEPDDSQGITYGDLDVGLQTLFDTLAGAPFDDSVAILTRTTDVGSVDITQVPEPTNLAIFGLGLLGLAGAARRKKA